MMRSLWTAGSGMIAQQLNVDVISNNLSNVNTTAYKKQRAEFKDTLYETMSRAYLLGDKGRPTNLQVGNGTAVASVIRNFERGNMEKTDSKLDFAIDGEAFFMIYGPRDEIEYTRDGSFKLSVTENGNKLTTSDGYPVLDDSGNDIYLDIDIATLNVSDLGELMYTEAESGETISLGQSLGIVKFSNRQALENTGSNMYKWNSAAGEPIPDYETGQRSIIMQGRLEASNVQVVDEMVKLIVAQRAYEINSKAIQSSDEMLGIANNLKR